MHFVVQYIGREYVSVHIQIHCAAAIRNYIIKKKVGKKPCKPKL